VEFDTQGFRALSGDPALKDLFIGSTDAICVKAASPEFNEAMSVKTLMALIEYLLEGLDGSLTYTSLGIPDRLFLLAVCILRKLPKDKRQEWWTNFIRSLALGADLSDVFPQYLDWLLLHPFSGMANTFSGPAKELEDEARQAIERVVALFYGASKEMLDWALAVHAVKQVELKLRGILDAALDTAQDAGDTSGSITHADNPAIHTIHIALAAAGLVLFRSRRGSSTCSRSWPDRPPPTNDRQML
jgi:hypothetical protein